MNQQQIDYQRVADAIDYFQKNFKTQPNLDDVAKNINLSPFHFQRLFSEWAGVSPKTFLQYLSIGYAKQILQDQHGTLFDVAHQTGLSGTGRLHDLFIKIEGMTPGEYKNEGQGLTINYSFSDTRFGNILVASTPKGICYMAFTEAAQSKPEQLYAKFPNATFIETVDPLQQNALSIFAEDWSNLNQIKLHLKGTDFQLKVWETLLKIPMGELSTYGNIAGTIQLPMAARAVGTAIGSNPVAFLIPCHRVIQSTGVLGQYRWGSTRKAAMICWEASSMERTIGMVG